MAKTTTSSGPTGGMIVGIAALFRDAASTMQEPERSEYLYKQWNLLLEYTTKERMKMEATAEKMQINQEKLRALARVADAKTKAALAETDAKTQRQYMEDVKDLNTKILDVQGELAAQNVALTETNISAAKEKANLHGGITTVDDKAGLIKASSGGMFEEGSVNAFNPAGLEAYTIRIEQETGKKWDDIVKNGLPKENGVNALDGETMDRVRRIDMTMKTAKDATTKARMASTTDFHALMPGSPEWRKAAADATSSLQVYAEAGKELSPVDVQKQTEAMAAENKEYQANLKRMRDLETEAGTPDDLFTKRGKIVSWEPFRTWALANGYEIGEANVDSDTDKLINYVSGKDDKRTIRKYGHELKRHPRSEAVTQKPTPLVGVDVKEDVPVNPLKVSQKMEDNSRYFTDPDTGKTWKQDEAGVVSEAQNIPEGVNYKDAAVWDKESKSPKRFADIDDMETPAVLGSETEAVLPVETPEDIEKARMGTPGATKVETIHGKKEKLGAWESIEGKERVTGAQGTETINKPRIKEERVVKPGRNPHMSGEKAEDLAAKLDREKLTEGDEAVESGIRGPISEESKALMAEVEPDRNRGIVKAALERMAKRGKAKPTIVFATSGLPEDLPPIDRSVGVYNEPRVKGVEPAKREEKVLPEPGAPVGTMAALEGKNLKIIDHPTDFTKSGPMKMIIDQDTGNVYRLDPDTGAVTVQEATREKKAQTPVTPKPAEPAPDQAVADNHWNPGWPGKDWK